MKVFLIGFMGCGKTTLGKKLAGKMGYAFLDLDHQLEQEMGMSVADYFAAYGEDAFRRQEQKTLQGYDYPEQVIVATGGGAPCYFDNMDWINANGLSVYISLSPAALAKRLEKGKAKRPLLKDLNEEEMVDFIQQRLEQREPYYRQAKIIAEGISLDADALRKLIFPDL